MKSLTQLSKKQTFLPIFFAGIVGNISPPPAISKYTGGAKGQGLFTFFSNALKLVAVVAGLTMLFQFIMAGYEFITANGDAKKVEAAFAKIWQSLLGMVIIASAFALAGLVKRFTGLDIINPTIYGPQP